MVRDSENCRVYETEFPAGDGSVVTTTVKAIAAIEGVETTELPCFEREMSGDGLSAVIESNGDVEVQFPYAGYEVTVRGDGTLKIREAE